MRCHYCSRTADVTVEKEGIRVGVCEEHLRERLEDMASADFLAAVDDADGDLDALE